MASPLQMDSEEVLLEVDPLDLKFPFELKKKTTSCTLRLSNKTDGIIAFKCEDKFLIQRIVIHEYDIEKHIIKDMFEESSEKVFDQIMRVRYTSPVPESSSCSSHKPCALESHVETSASADAVKQEEKLESLALVSTLSKVKNAAIQLSSGFLQELTKREGNEQLQGGFSLTFVVFIAVLGILLGYSLKKT